MSNYGVAEIWKETVLGIHMEGKSETKNRTGQACSRRNQVQSVVAVSPPDGKEYLRTTHFYLQQQNLSPNLGVNPFLRQKNLQRLDYGLGDSGFASWQRQEVCLSSDVSGPTLWPTQTRVHWVPGNTPRVNRSG